MSTRGSLAPALGGAFGIISVHALAGRHPHQRASLRRAGPRRGRRVLPLQPLAEGQELACPVAGLRRGRTHGSRPGARAAWTALKVGKLLCALESQQARSADRQWSA